MAWHARHEDGRPAPRRGGRRRSRQDGERPDPDATEQIRSALGLQMRKVRERRRMSVRGLATQVGVTAGFLSQIENGHVMPSVATLVRIASVLDVQVGELFDQPQPPSPVVRPEDREIYSYPEHGVRDELISADPTGQLEVLFSHVEPSGGTGDETYTHGSRAEFVLVLKGEIEMRVGDDVEVLREGETITFSGDLPHGMINRSSEPTDLLWVITPVTY
jgi:transcriptional regulator with XRE-family HTH domain